MPDIVWDHVHIRTPDVDATAQWFKQMFGADIVHSKPPAAPRTDVVIGGMSIFLAPVKPGDGVNAAPVTPYQGLDHFGLKVKDIDGWAAELKAKGVEFTMEPNVPRPGLKICFIRGPQGISIELLERDPKYV